MENKIVEKCGEQFTLTTYLGVTLIIDEDDFILGAKICRDNGKEFKNWLKLESTKEAISNYQEDVAIKACFRRRQNCPTMENPF